MSTQTPYLYAGVYTRLEPHLTSARGRGLYVFRFDPLTGGLAFASEMPGIDNPSYLAIDPQNRFLYAVSEVWDWPEGWISAYAIDPATGGLTFLNGQPSRGWLAVHTSVDKTGRWLAVANYMAGNAVLMSLHADGQVGDAADVAQHTGSGPDPSRQERPHPHCVVFDPNNRFVFAADLGTDQIVGYRLDAASGRLIGASICALPPGSGPRHLVFHPNGLFAYVINELNSALGALAYDGDRGALELLQLAPALPEGCDSRNNACADIHVHPSGKFLYGSNRGHDSIVIYAIDQQTGRLSSIGHELTGGRTPRSFAIDPSGAFLLAANQDSDTIVSFRLDTQTGELSATGSVTPCPTPVCLKFAALQVNTGQAAR